MQFKRVVPAALAVVLSLGVIVASAGFPERATAAIQADSVPANPNAIQKAKDIQALLANLPNSSTNRILSGQFSGYPNVNNLGWNSFSMNAVNEISTQSGLFPKLTGADFTGRTSADNSPCRVFRASAVNPTLKTWWNNAGYVTTFSHFPRPDMYDIASGSGCGLKDTPYDMARILPGGTDRAKWVAMMDKEIAALKDLQTAGVVAFHRLFAELNGPFWWGGQNVSTFVNVWRDAFNYYKSKGVNNVLWVYNTQGFSTRNYPGSAYVDIVSGNLYGGTWPSTESYNAMINLGKPFAIGEFGPVGGVPAPPVGGAGFDPPPNNYDFRDLINQIRNRYPLTTYFLVWHDGYRIGNGNFVNEFMDDPWLLNRGEAPGPGGSTEFVIDNGSAGFSTVGTWTASSALPGYYGSNYLHDGSTATDPTKSANWTSPITTAGTYSVYMRWTSSADRPDAAPVEVNYNGGIANVTVNQKNGGGTWVLIGTWSFTGGSGDYVKITGADAGYTIADAVRWVKQ